MPRLTKRLVEAISPDAGRDVIQWDSELRGFGVRVWPSGKRTYFVKYRTKDGRQRKPTIGVHGVLTAEQARDEARQWLAQVARGEDPASKPQPKEAPTVEAFAEMYLNRHARLHKKRSSSANDQRLLAKRILPALGNRKLVDITREDVVRLHEALHHRPYEGNRLLALLSTMFNLAEDWGFRAVHTNPCRRVKKYKEEKRERFLGSADLARLGAALREAEQSGAHSTSAIGAIRLLLFTGCRLSEILTLRWSEVDLEHGLLRLSESKTGKKMVCLNAAARAVLEELPRREDNPHVLPGRRPGAHLVNLEKPWRDIRGRAALDDLRLHDLRHTFASAGAIASAGAMSGLSLSMVGGLLGHKELSTTNGYTHWAAEPLREAAEAIGAYLASATAEPARREPREM